jgi:hypothetical protein
MRTSPSLGILGGPSAIGTASLGMSVEADDIDAITKYVTSTSVKTDAARKKQDEYKAWIDTVSWYDKNYDRPTYDHARNLRNEFNLANATTPTEVAIVKNIITTGFTGEQQRGEPTRISSEGKFSEKPEGGVVQMPSWAKWTIAAAVGVGVLYGLGKVTALAQIFAGKRQAAHAQNPRRRRPR